MAQPNSTPKHGDSDSIDENMHVEQQDVAHNEDHLMVHRLHTNLTDTLESHSDVKKKPANYEKGTSTAIDIPSSQDEKVEEVSTDEPDEEVKNPSKFSLFYRRHLPWFQ